MKPERVFHEKVMLWFYRHNIGGAKQTVGLARKLRNVPSVICKMI